MQANRANPTTPRTTPKLSLRERQRAAVRAEITLAAMELFLAHGFDETTADQIAERAGVSRSSFFRHFPTKEDVVLASFATAGERVRDALRARPADESAWEALAHAAAVLLDSFVDDPERSLRASAMLTHTPSLRARHIEKQLLWQELLIPDVRARLGGGDDVGPPDARARALVTAALGCTDAAIHEWVRAEGDADILGLYADALATVHTGTR
ncbi:MULTISPECIES: TetR family transcriptional regulator [Streptomyces]|uniref:TetR family transcriptional regulator n=1 Tax=Streptomyces mirabilis TaxID=68239 RepID=A0ABU3US32_9ACTN|nr:MULTISPECIES: TetR family transcriptional regulator [Streptomyces]MCX4609615.1 TetR/AcrR family transcriptional regulator [Streptomyces mirabilis]MCX5349896.1 TetR/AcrR family transcriptional regulator [Streptomyces mirabilis]MDU8996720.1 TetR family transcriptional regulator [Streptomyces mirabilis]QDN88316.1 TetR family transcriptional regulator [Streptomyces sp. RLB3-6]QDO09169.1 TetR family transcriptional regulator [Streptomyces sp. S1D4-23]